LSSWYNHIALGTAEKPLIPNGELKRIFEELDKGNMEVLKELEQWSLMQIHKLIIQDKIDFYDRQQRNVHGAARNGNE
jgi:hypothetical protein